MSEGIVKPCPFCGGEADLRYSFKGTYIVLCEKCYVQTQHYKTIRKAVKAWNRRVDNE